MGNIEKGAIKVHTCDWHANGKLLLDTWHWTPTWWHPDKVTNRHTVKTNHSQEFCIDSIIVIIMMNKILKTWNIIFKNIHCSYWQLGSKDKCFCFFPRRNSNESYMYNLMVLSAVQIFLHVSLSTFTVMLVWDFFHEFFFVCLTAWKKINKLFAGLRSVRIVKNCDLRHFQDLSHSFSLYMDPPAGK